MFAEHIREALSQVRQVQHAVLERQLFRGYSGIARMLSGTAALATAAVMTTRFYPQSNKAFILGWGGIFVAASLMNLSALLYWFLNDEHVGRHPRRLKPLLDSIPPLAVGGIITFDYIVTSNFQPLYGIWMCMFGLCNLASRYVLPRSISLVGLFYLLCGMIWLLTPHASFSNPWPMGIVFFAGEWAGGLILHFDKRRYLELVRYTNEEDVPHEE